MSVFNPGDLRHRIDIFANVPVINSYHETTYEFKKVNTVWAAIIPQTGILQRQQVGTILTNVTHKIIVRYEAGKAITKDMQIGFEGHRFEIKYILDPYFKHKSLEIFCQEVLS